MQTPHCKVGASAQNHPQVEQKVAGRDEGSSEAAVKRPRQRARLPSSVTLACRLGSLLPATSNYHRGLFSLGVAIFFFFNVHC